MFEKRAAKDGVIAPDRGPEAIARVRAPLEQGSHERQVLASRRREPDRSGAEILFVLVHRDGGFEIGAGVEKRGGRTSSVGLLEAGRGLLDRTGLMQARAPFRIGRGGEARGGREQRRDGRGVPPADRVKKRRLRGDPQFQARRSDGACAASCGVSARIARKPPKAAALIRRTRVTAPAERASQAPLARQLKTTPPS